MHPSDFIRAYPNHKYWTLYDSKDKKVADFTGDGGDGTAEFEKFYGMLSDGKYKLCVHKTERLDRGCYNFSFTKTATTMSGNQGFSGGNSQSDFMLKLVADNARYGVLIEQFDKRLDKIEARIEQVALAIDELTDEDDSNDETALSRLKNDFGNVAGMAANAKKFFS
ncbi:hypothetical protein [Runella sp.]|uniref:hypothetical protein n=1 Tax=Runella sp. TaxID=1960881 RepID=UPI003D1024C6